MDNFEFLIPHVEDEINQYRIDEFCLGSKVHFWQGEELDFSNFEIALISLQETSEDYNSNIKGIRSRLYKLYPGNWQKKIVDLGNLPLATTYKDSEFLIKNILHVLLKSNVIPIILGSDQKNTLAQYRAYDEVKYMVNVANVDASFDLGDAESELSSSNFIGRMIVDKPYNLFNYANLGYQSYYVRQDEVELVEKLFFEAYRLGEVLADVRLVEPILRDSDMLSIDLRSAKNAEFPNVDSGMINGFQVKELCAIARYAGLSEKLSSLGLYHIDKYPQSTTFFEAVAQVIWYFIEGLHFRRKETVNIKNPNFIKYIVPVEEEELIFYKSSFSGRWWIEIPQFLATNNKLKDKALLPCTEDNYLSACNQELPERWLKAKRKNEI